ncbi:hypothetical protein LEN26_008370 [Aphanomyces euteiches]|nr:hypothetical protein LEN26_008370 [Aphanomyces euteiches]
MAKVIDAARVKRTVRFSRYSLCYTGLFVLKLAGTPLFAYLTEPLPWSLPQRSVATWNSFDAFNNATYEYLHQLYNSETVSTTRATHFDSTTITNVM